jgi:hypothetical protein
MAVAVQKFVAQSIQNCRVGEFIKPRQPVEEELTAVHQALAEVKRGKQQVGKETGTRLGFNREDWAPAKQLYWELIHGQSQSAYAMYLSSRLHKRHCKHSKTSKRRILWDLHVSLYQSLSVLSSLSGLPLIPCVC